MYFHILTINNQKLKKPHLPLSKNYMKYLGTKLTKDGQFSETIKH